MRGRRLLAAHRSGLGNDVAVQGPSHWLGKRGNARDAALEVLAAHRLLLPRREVF
jgi:hypothetical protein